MRKAYCIIILCISVSGVFAQNVAAIDGKPITNKEFIWFYKKNHTNHAKITAESLEAYLNQYINFKLKVLEAMEMGLDADTAYIAEIRNYEQTLAAQNKIAKTSSMYKMTMNEYKEAALMFNISELKIWSKPMDDQKDLEETWINALREKHTIKINQTEVRKLAKL